MAVTFNQAREIVRRSIPGGGEVSTRGWAGPVHWFPLILPQRDGGRVPRVRRDSGELSWVSSLDDEFASAEVVEVLSPPSDTSSVDVS